MKELKTLLLLVIMTFCMSSSFAQKGIIVADGDKYGVMSMDENWIINPIYEYIYKVEGERDYYLLFNHVGVNFYEEEGRFGIVDDWLIFGDGEFSDFLIADEDFYVMSVQSYQSMEYEYTQEDPMKNLIYLYHSEGVDFISVERNKHYELGYINNVLHILPDYLVAMNETQKGVFSLKSDIYILETLYEGIFSPYSVFNDEIISLDTGEIEYWESEINISELEHLLVIENQGNLRLFDLNKEEWISDEVPGTYVHVLDEDGKRVINQVGDKQVLYSNGEKVFEAYHFNVMPF